MNKHDGKRVVVVGAGNIGSQVVPLLARVTAVAQALIVDFDHYETKNLASQNITPGDVGRSKAAAMARALRRLNPRIGVQAACARIEAMPLGALRSDVILACLDSRQARRTVNRMAWRLGIPWIDAAVDQSGLFARVNVYRPAQDAPCLECAWEARDYELLSQEFSCSGEHRVPATNATAGLGALAAALQILELQKILEQDWTHAAAGTQFLIDARHHASLRSVSRRNSGCRFDHRIWAIEQMAAPQSVSLSEGFAALHAGAGCRQDGDSVLRLEGMTFINALWCPACTRRQALAYVEGRLPPRRQVCPRCGGQFAVIERNDRLAQAALSAARSQAPLSRLGLRGGDVVTLATSSRELHVQLGTSKHGAAACVTTF